MAMRIPALILIAACVFQAAPALAQPSPQDTPPREYLLARVSGQPGAKMDFVDETSLKHTRTKDGHDVVDAWVFRAQPQRSNCLNVLPCDGYWLRTTFDCLARTSRIQAAVLIDETGGMISWMDKPQPPQAVTPGSFSDAPMRRACGEQAGKTDRFRQAKAAIAFSRSR